MRKICLTSVLLVCGCIDINIPEQITFLGNSKTVLAGRMSESANSACPLWVADNGLQFVLFQNARISNADFDAIVLPGVTSRLELKGRSDLGDSCAPDAENAEVTLILEINGEDFTQITLRELREHVENLLEDAKTRLSEKRDEIAAELRDLVDQAEENLEARKDELHQTVNDIYESVRDRLEDRDSLRDQLDDFVSEVRQRIDDAVEEFEESKEQLADNLRDRVDQSVEDLRASIQDAIQELEDRLQGSDLGQEALKYLLTEVANGIRARIEDELEQKRQEIVSRLEQLRQEFEARLQAWLDELRDRIPGDLPDPDQGIPPILDELLPDAEDLVTWIRENAQVFIGQIIEDLRTLIDELRDDADATVDDAIASFLEDVSAADAVDEIAQ